MACTAKLDRSDASAVGLNGDCLYKVLTPGRM